MMNVFHTGQVVWPGMAQTDGLPGKLKQNLPTEPWQSHGSHIGVTQNVTPFNRNHLCQGVFDDLFEAAEDLAFERGAIPGERNQRNHGFLQFFCWNMEEEKHRETFKRRVAALYSCLMVSLVQ